MTQVREPSLISDAFVRAGLINDGLLLPKGETSYGRAAFKALETARALAASSVAEQRRTKQYIQPIARAA